MSSLSPLFRFYTLPVLVLLLGALLSWALFKYEYKHENLQIQSEYKFRALDHSAGFRMGIHMLSSKINMLENVLEHEIDSGEELDSNADLEHFVRLFLADSKSIRDIMYYASSDDLLDSDGVPAAEVLHVDSAWHSKHLNSVKHIVEAFKSSVENKKKITLIVNQSDNQPWAYEVIPMMKNGEFLGWLVVSWDVGQELERVLTMLPVSGQDILFKFGDALTIQADGGLKKAQYIHRSRSRERYVASNDGRHFQWLDNIEIMGRIWELRYDSAPGFLITHPIKNAWNVFYGGLLMSVLLALLTLLLYRRTRMIQSLVDIRTKQLKSAQKRVHLLIDSLAEGLFDMDKEGVCTFINQRALDLLGYGHANEVIGQHIHELIHHSNGDSTLIAHEHCKIAAVMDTAKAIRVDDEVFWRADGSPLSISYHATPVHDDTGDVVSIVVSFLDISAQLVAEQEREQMRKQVEHTQRLESLGVLAGGIAHDFNNLLSTIMGNASLALNHVGDAAYVMKYMQRINKACVRASDLCQQMLAYSGQGQVKKDSLNVSELVQDMGQLLEVSLTKGVHLDFCLADPIRLVHADVAQIQQIVMNLLTNANEAMSGQQGSIRLTTGVIDVNEDFLQGCYGNYHMTPGTYAFFEVHDHGCGMDHATTERIFEPFFTTKFTGRGLGMSAVLGIVRAHGGVLKMDSVLGKGTCIRVLFPALDGESCLLPPYQQNSEHSVVDVSQDTQGLVLVVDDEESLREVAGLMLEDMGYQVLFAEDGLQALDVFAQHSNDIDLVVLDLTMPKMGGEACMQALQGLRADIPILISSGYSVEQLTKFKHFLPKPYSEVLFQEKVNEALHTER